MGKDSQKYAPSLVYNILAASFIVIAIVIAFQIYHAYFNAQKVDSSDLADVSGLIAVSTGSCLSIAGLLFVVANLRLQRESNIIQQKELQNSIIEMRASNAQFENQNQVLLNQQYQTTFFNLLASHQNLANSLSYFGIQGQPGMQDAYNKTSQAIVRYNASLQSGIFYRASTTQQSPLDFVDTIRDQIEQLIRDLKTLLSLTEEKLDFRLYFEIINNQIPITEKYFIGLYYYLYNQHQIDYFSKSSRGLLDYFKNHPHFYHLKIANYFPSIELTRFQNYSQFDWSKGELPSNHFSFKLSLLRDYFNSGLELAELHIHPYHYGTKGAIVYFGKIEEKFAKPELLTGSKSSQIALEDKFAEILTQSINKTFYIRIIFIVYYNKTKFNIHYECNITWHQARESIQEGRYSVTIGNEAF